MTVRYSADLDAIADHAARAQAFDAAVRDALTRLDAVVADLHVTWVGAAAEAHAAAHAEWTRSAAAMREAVAAMGMAAHSARDSYDAAAEANLHSWGPLA